MSNIEKEKNITDFKHPGRILGLIYPYLLVIGLGIGLYYISKLDFIARQDVPPALPDTTKDEGLKLIEPQTTPAVNIDEISKPTDELLSKGEEIYKSTCLSCHGENGQGKGPAGVALQPPPRDFTGKEGWKNGPSISGIFTTLQEGIPGTPMVSYEQLTPEEKFGLVHYIRKEFVPDPPEPSEENITALDEKYNLSKGKDVAAQIPVSAAMDIIINENNPKIEKINDIEKDISDSNSSEAKLFKKVTQDQKKALASLSGSKDWIEDRSKFVNLLVNNVPENGFNRNVFKLNASQLTQLQSYLAGYF